ncbi:MAG: serine hydrolase domain-containing protein [Pseudomonadota bacterium]
MIRVVAATLALVFLAGMVMAQDTADRVRAAWEGWRAEHGDQTAPLVLLDRGEPILRVGDVAEPRELLASNGKVITALCIDALAVEGRLRFDQGLPELLGRAAPDATLGELITHSGGLRPDETQRGRMFWWLYRTAPRHAQVTDWVIARGPAGAKTHFYNNENYALLGEVIARVTGAPYAEVCRRRVLDPLDLTAALSPVTGALGPWGGWRMSTEDYARFHWATFGANARIGADPFAWPHVRIGPGVYYGMGALFRTEPVAAFWHAGALNFVLGPRLGAFAITWDARWTVAVAHRGFADDDAILSLVRQLAAALRIG